MIVFLIPCFLSLLALAELQSACLITSEKCKGLYGPSDVVRVQSGKSPEVQNRTADIVKKHGFQREANLLAGEQVQPLIYVPVVCCTVEPICKGQLKASIIIVSFTHTMLG